MCYLCLQSNPFGIEDLSRKKLEDKKTRAKLIKELLEFYAKEITCEDGDKEIEKLKKEQYEIARSL
jgi:hypothetical protein